METSPQPRRAAPERAVESSALERGVQALLARGRQGEYEAEMRWCAMLTAQYVIAHVLTGRAIPEARRRSLLRYFERSRGEHGLYGLHDHAGPSLFVSTLVYVAARCLGAPASTPWLAPCRKLFAEHDVLTIPTWGRVWLALLDVYAWEGVHPMPVWVWALPRALPVHPGRLYCHTRMIYLGVSLLRSEEPQPGAGALTRELRAELYPGRDYASLPFAAMRSEVSPLDRVASEHPVLRAAYRASALSERVTKPHHFATLRAQLREHVRFELRSSDHLGLSPVSGLLGALALHQTNPNDPDVDRVFAQLEHWVFEDPEEGARVTGARSLTWDTAFALRALHAARGAGEPVTDADLDAARSTLAAQQIRTSLRAHADHYRADPRGGFCFSTREHGWPVSDCTAEALAALLERDPEATPRAQLDDAVRFILRCQNPDGSFGSYEARRTEVPLEALNPSEMFLECMVEASYVECTGSCMEALARYARFALDGSLVRDARESLTRGDAFLRASQRPDGTWAGAWGVHFLYGTLFGVRGLRAAGATPNDPRVVRALTFLMANQRKDGGFGEHESSALEDRYVPLPTGHSVQTAWALLTMTEGGSACAHKARERAAAYLEAHQATDGSWPRERMVGVFFRTALVDYDLYRTYFPVWALAAHQSCVGHE
ncbi:MAG: 2,3-oxidosqualene cyclase [Sandaracinaceae bacterium]|nr:2,3-oxidosqualene cyclase [Sandaracinaceae bacterium]